MTLAGPVAGGAFLALAMAGTALAADTPAIHSPVSVGEAVQVLLGLGAVLVVIALLAWLMRRVGPGQTGAGGAIRVVGGIAVGPKERVVIVEVDETWLLVGVAPGLVNTLHTLPKPQPKVEVASAAPRGASWLRRALDGRQKTPG